MLRLLSMILYVCMNFLIYCRCYKPSIAKDVLLGFAEIIFFEVSIKVISGTLPK